MKKKILRTVFILMMIAGAANSSFAQRFYVKVRPSIAVATRPVCPHAGYVWVEGDWVWANNAYVWHAGYWAAPPRPHAVWVPGHWVRERRGYYWIGGRWRY